MSYRDNERIKDCVECLAKLINPTQIVSIDTVEKLVRFLRPAGSGSHEHSRAIKESIRRSILNHPSSGSDGLNIQNKFDKECLKLDYKLLKPFLSLFKPLSYHIDTVKPTISSTSSHRSNVDEFTTASVINNNIKNGTLHLPKAHFNPPEAPSDAPELNNDNDYDEFNSLMDTNVMWTQRDTEMKLITDLIYVFQGVAGKHIKYDARSESYILDPALRLNNTVRDSVLCLCELGWLYGKVMAYANKLSVVPSASETDAGSTVASAGDNRGLVTQAFGFAIQEELNDYYRLLAVLEQEAKRTAATLSGNRHNQHSPIKATATSAEGDAVGSSGLTLLRLKAWMQEPIERMCLLARLVDSAGPLAGGALASRLHFHSRHGDPAACTVIQRVMYSVCVPLYTILTRWLLHGELNDPHSEFFIGMQATSAQQTVLLRNVWRETYFLRPPMLPTFLSSLLAQKILVIGKSINFIKLCIQKLPKKDTNVDSRANAQHKRRSYREVNKAKRLTTGGRVVDDNEVAAEAASTAAEDATGSEANADKDVEDANDLPSAISSALSMTTTGQLPTRAHDILSDITTEEVERALHSLKYGKEQLLSEIVANISPAIDARLLQLMQSRFHVDVHFSALKKFMLLGQGDFVTCLMDGVGPELKKRSSQLFRHNLTGILESAIRSSNAQYEPSFVTDRIGVRLLEAAPGDSGWEIFSLDYSIYSPLNAVVHGDAMAKYRVAFHMLWRLKRVEWTLANAWKQLTSFTHSNRHDISEHLQLVFHKCTLHRARMMHVVNNLCAFLMFEVMESAWVTLQDTTRSAACLDDVIRAHDAYLSEILDKALLAPQHEELNKLVQQLLQSILKFCTSEQSLVDDANACVERKRVARSLAEERGQWADESPAAADELLNRYDGVPVKVIERLEDQVTLYNTQFDTLMATLRDQGETAGEILRFLTFRLDFNDYHQLQRESGAGNKAAVGVSPLVSNNPLRHQQHFGGRGANSALFHGGAGIQLDQDYSPVK